jgi:tuftelin-interacting protein 11
MEIHRGPDQGKSFSRRGNPIKNESFFSLSLMARRKRQFMDDGDSSGDSESDGGFDDEDPYQSKRRKINGEDTEKRSDWTKAPAFVSGDSVDLDKSIEIDDEMADNAEGEEAEEEGEDSDEEGEDLDEEEDEEDLDDSQQPSRVPSPRIREEEDEEPPPRPRFGGIGSGTSRSNPTESFSGFKKGGIGSSKPVPATQLSRSPSPTPESFPSAFGAARAQRSFIRSDSPASKPATPLPAHERAHFSKLGGFGAKMMEKMGWQAGMGLGTTGEGIVIPVESKLRPKNMGIAFKGFKEKTEQSKLEAKRRGEEVSDDDDDARPKKGGKKAAKEPKRSDAWKKPKKVKTKVEHKTYEQIIAEAGQDAAPAGIGMIIDATGATVSIYFDPCFMPYLT